MFLKIFDRISDSSLPRITPTQIICGDCAGEELLPIRTNLTTAGLCAECGGRNYEFASVIGARLAQHLQITKEKNNDTETLKNDQPTRSSRTSAKQFRLVQR